MSHTRLLLLLTAGAAALGGVAGAAFGWTRTLACWCCDPENEEPL